jgi:hypothetical protein
MAHHASQLIAKVRKKYAPRPAPAAVRARASFTSE